MENATPRRRGTLSTPSRLRHLRRRLVSDPSFLCTAPPGQPLFDALAKPATVQQILKEPYFDADMVTDELVDVLINY